MVPLPPGVRMSDEGLAAMVKSPDEVDATIDSTNTEDVLAANVASPL